MSNDPAAIFKEADDMHTMKRQVLSSCKAVGAAAGLLLGVAMFAYGGDGTSAHAMRLCSIPPPP